MLDIMLELEHILDTIDDLDPDTQYHIIAQLTIDARKLQAQLN